MAAVTVATLEARLIANTKQFIAGMTAAEGSMSAASKGMTLASGAVIAGVGLMGMKAVSAAADYEAGLNTMQAVSGATAEQMKGISKLAIALGNDIKLPGTSAKDAAEAMTELSKSGMSIDQTMKAVRPTLLLSAAAQISNARAAEITSNALNAFGLDASRTSKIVDVLANAANASSLEIEDVADSMKMAGAVFSGIQGPVVGAEQAMKDLTTATALLGNAGIKGSDAGTSLKQALLSLTGPSDKSKDAMKALYAATQDTGIATDTLTAAISGNNTERGKALKSILDSSQATREGGDIAYTASGQMRSLSEIVELTSKATANMTQEQRNAALTQIFGADAMRAIIVLMKQGKTGWDEMSDAIDKNGSAQDLANAKMKGLRGAQEALKSTMDTLAITFGLVLLPYVTKLTQALTTATGVIAEHQTAAIAITGVLVTLAATWLSVRLAIAAYGVAVTLVTASTAALSAGMIVLRAAVVGMIAVQLALNAALLANPIGVVIVAIAALVAGILIAYNRSQTFRDIVDEVWSSLKRMGGWIMENWGTISGIIEKAPLVMAIRAIVTNVDNAYDAFKRLGGWISETWGTAVDKFSSSGIITFLRGLLDAINDVYRAFLKVIDVIQDAIGWIGKLKVPDLSKLDPRNWGDPRDPNFTGPPTPTGPFQGIDLMGARPEMMPFAVSAQGMGLRVTSGLRPGAITANGTPSDHGIGKALDLSNGYNTPQMAAFFKSLIGNASVKQAFYDPLGSIFGGRWSSYREGGHTDHVHVATYDKGGWLKPGLTLAYNGTGAPERVGGRGDIHLHFHGDMYGKPPRQFFNQVRDGLRELDLLQTGGRVLNATPTLS
jgi:TP901 family phage tail tape measure protein